MSRRHHAFARNEQSPEETNDKRAMNVLRGQRY
jgi:hypothetical protein